ncbi:MAG: hypothetical protein WCP15_01675 [bacterium]
MNTLNGIVYLLIDFLVYILLPLGIVSGIALAFISREEQDLEKKKKLKKYMKYSFILPILLLLVLLSIWGVIMVANNPTGKIQ